MRHLLVFLVFAVTFAICLFHQANAQSIGVTPAKLAVDVFRGEKAEAQFYIINPSKRAVEYYAEPNTSWMYVYPSSASVNPKSRKAISLFVEPPSFLQNGTKKAMVLVYQAGQEKNGAKMLLGAAVIININVYGAQKIDAVIESFSAYDSEQGDKALLEVMLANKGNVAIMPEARIEILKEQNIVGNVSSNLEESLPGGSSVTRLYWNTTGALPGEYSALLKVFLNNKTLKSKAYFKVFPPGTLSKKGTLDELEVDARLNSYSTVKAVFTNTCNKTLHARFFGELFRDNGNGAELVRLVESDYLIVNAHEQKELKAYFKIRTPGRYRLIGKVVYDGFETKELEKEFFLGSITSPAASPLTGNAVFNLEKAGSPAVLATALIVTALIYWWARRRS